MRKLKFAKSGEVVKFNGLSILSCPEELKRYTNKKEFITNLSTGSSSTVNKISKSCMDKMSFNRNGFLNINNKKYKLYNNGLGQILNYLDIPIKYAARIPSDLLIDTINRLLAESYNKKLNYKSIGTNIFAIFPHNLEIFTSHSVFSSLLKKDKLGENDLKFLFATTQGWTTMVMLSLGGIKDKDDDSAGHAAIEILYSDSGECKPTVSGMIVSSKGHAIIPNLSFQVDITHTPYKLFLKSLETVIVKIKQDIAPYVEKFNKMGKTKITPALDAKLQNKASKVLPVKINSMKGKTMDEIFEQLSKARSGKEWTLWERRNFAQYIGKTLEFVT